MSEAVTQAEIRLALGSRPTGRCFRNNTGALTDRFGRLVHFGLSEFSADLIHIESVTITPEMVGQTFGVFCSIEVKRSGRDTTSPKRKKGQTAWRNMVLRFGGRAGIARNIQEALAIVTGSALPIADAVAQPHKNTAQPNAEE